MSISKIDINQPEYFAASLWCYKRGDGAVFLNRKDEDIKTFSSYEEAIVFASNNMHLIDNKVL